MSSIYPVMLSAVLALCIGIIVYLRPLSTPDRHVSHITHEGNRTVVFFFGGKVAVYDGIHSYATNFQTLVPCSIRKVSS